MFGRRRYAPIELADAVVLVTGAARGIGLATARAFIARGAQVWMGDVDEAAVRAAAAAVGPRAHPHALDVTDRASFAAFADAATHAHGRIDVLVNNAGVMPLGAFLDERDAISRLTLEVNLWGLIVGTRVVAPGMVTRRRGHIVNVASMAGKIAIPGMAVYNATKFGAVGLSAALRRELAPAGVSVSAVLPSAVRTELASGVPLGRGMPTVEPDAIAAAVLASVASRRAELAVPRYLAGWDLLDALVPESIQAWGRALIGERRALTSVDPAARRTYADRVAAQADGRPPPATPRAG